MIIDSKLPEKSRKLVSKGFCRLKLDIGIPTHLEFLPELGLLGSRDRNDTALYVYLSEVSILIKILFKGGNFKGWIGRNYLCFG